LEDAAAAAADRRSAARTRDADAAEALRANLELHVIASEADGIVRFTSLRPVYEVRWLLYSLQAAWRLTLMSAHRLDSSFFLGPPTFAV
jgi:hypothetical protein